LEVLITIIGNFIGCLIMGYFFQFPLAETMVQGKIDLFFADGGLIDAIVKGVMCGVLMYIAVDVYKSKGSYLGVFICVPVFILAGFEHSIADMFYISSAMMWNMDTFLFTLAILFGNLIGCCLIPAYRLFVNGEEKA
jgi:formate/nitrite transporter FocA (FNT family)